MLVSVIYIKQNTLQNGDWVGVQFNSPILAKTNTVIPEHPNAPFLLTQRTDFVIKLQKRIVEVTVRTPYAMHILFPDCCLKKKRAGILHLFCYKCAACINISEKRECSKKSKIIYKREREERGREREREREREMQHLYLV
uniref:Uncharacterized protein n=1 Tax=Micrurus lemniscatus lemniscatus TaxID=129467 RepID=A0A2D4HF27_MICLE